MQLKTGRQADNLQRIMHGCSPTIQPCNFDPVLSVPTAARNWLLIRHVLLTEHIRFDLDGPGFTQCRRGEYGIRENNPREQSQHQADAECITTFCTVLPDVRVRRSRDCGLSVVSTISTTAAGLQRFCCMGTKLNARMSSRGERTQPRPDQASMSFASWPRRNFS